jgi:hypothetical protein
MSVGPSKSPINNALGSKRVEVAADVCPPRVESITTVARPPEEIEDGQVDILQTASCGSAGDRGRSSEHRNRAG